MALAASLTLDSRVRPRLRLGLHLSSRVGETRFELSEAPLELLEPAPDGAGRLVPPSRQARATLLTPPRQLVARPAPAADDIVDQVRRPLAGTGR
jgi:hypothetical protein